MKLLSDLEILKFFPKKYLFDVFWFKDSSTFLPISSFTCLFTKILEFKSLQVFSCITPSILLFSNHWKWSLCITPINVIKFFLKTLVLSNWWNNPASIILTLFLKFSAYFKKAHVSISKTVALSSPKTFSVSFNNLKRFSSSISVSLNTKRSV